MTPVPVWLSTDLCLVTPTVEVYPVEGGDNEEGFRALLVGGALTVLEGRGEGQSEGRGGDKGEGEVEVKGEGKGKGEGEEARAPFWSVHTPNSSPVTWGEATREVAGGEIVRVLGTNKPSAAAAAAAAAAAGGDGGGGGQSSPHVTAGDATSGAAPFSTPLLSSRRGRARRGLWRIPGPGPRASRDTNSSHERGATEMANAAAAVAAVAVVAVSDVVAFPEVQGQYSQRRVTAARSGGVAVAVEVEVGVEVPSAAVHVDPVSIRAVAQARREWVS